jgi:hypothetical protein
MTGRLHPGLIAAALVLALYGGVAVSIDVPRVTLGIHSDEATYYLIGHSLAADGDLEYRREDLLRAFAEYPAGPSGVFLKKGQTIHGQPDPDQARLFFGKAFVYPLFAAPFIKMFGTNGFLVLNALLMAAVVLAAFAFLSARSSAGVSLVLSLAFVFATVVPAYAFWIAPELFNFALGCLAYFCWLYKEVAPPGRAKWLRDSRSDIVAAGIIGLLAFSKVTNALLVVPIVIWLAWRRQWKSAILTSAAFWIVMLAFFGVNVVTSGDWNYQGGMINGEVTRNTFYPHSDGAPGYPFEREGIGFDVGYEKARNDDLSEVIFGPDFWTNLRWNTVYVFLGRNAGLVPYFFPAVFAMGAFLAMRRHRAPWQWLVLASGVAQILIFMISQPYTWNGSGGSIGNRYFMSAYGIFVFLLPPIASIGAALVPAAIGLLFAGKIVLNPFYSSFNPDEHSWRGPLRMLPVERTLVMDLPANTDGTRVRIWFGADPRFQIYYLDDNSYFREPDDAFWVKGRSRADIFVKADQPVRTLQLGLRAGPQPVSGTVRLGWHRYNYDLQPGQSTTLAIDLGSGFPYQGTRVWTVSISTSSGFLPRAYVAESRDTRFLGVRVSPVLVR